MELGTPRDTVNFARLAYSAMQKLGINAEHVLNACGLDLTDLQNSQLRTPHSGQDVFWQFLEEYTNDQDIGIHMGNSMPVYKDPVFEYLFLSSDTFGAGLTRAHQYQRLVSDAITITPVFNENEVRLNHILGDSKSRHSNECFFIALIAFMSGSFS